MAISIYGLTIGDEPASWAALGFALDGDVCEVGSVRIRFASRGAGRGIVGWTLQGVASKALDGLPTTRADTQASTAGELHPNGIVALDHVVVITPALDRTVPVLQAAGLDLRRIREQPTPAGAPRQAFFRLGEVILEVVQAPEKAIERSGGPDSPAFFWGLAFKVADLDATVARLGERASPARAAVQPGRRIATLRRSAGVALPVALMSA
jgi:hypothetical protein